MPQVSDFEWIKGRIDDLATKWVSDENRYLRDQRILRDALEAILRVERDDKGNHFEVIRTLAFDAIQSLDC